MPLFSNPVKGVGSIAPPRPMVRSTIAPQQKQTSGDWWSALTGGHELKDGGMGQLGSLSSPRALSELGLGFGDLYGQSKGISSSILSQVQKNLPQRMRYNQQAAENLDPRNDPSRYRGFRANALGSAQAQGRGQANMLAQQGLGPEARAAAMLDAQNQAEDRSGQFLSQISSPENRAQRYQQASQLMGLEPYMAELGITTQQFQAMMQALLGAENLNLNQEGYKSSQEGGSFWDDILGIGASVIPGMGLFGGKGSVGGGNGGSWGSGGWGGDAAR